MNKQIREVLDEIIRVEGGYVNDPDDRGGETNFGITKAVARQHGYQGNMRDLPREIAEEIYLETYFNAHRYNEIECPAIAYEVFEQAVHMGNARANRHLQRAYNILNINKITVDGIIGPQTIKAINNYNHSNELNKVLNVLQGQFYISIVENDSSQKRFIRGWFRKRVKLETDFA